MSLESEIEDIRQGLKAGRFPSEAAVSQGIVLRLLHALGWPAYDTRVVWPEYSLNTRRVDFALCHPTSRPIAFIEVKQVGQSDGAERQLFEYAFHEGIPFAILTDGREWNFFLPGEQGDYGERRVYRLDIAERALDECVFRLQRYLLHSSMLSGDAIRNAREDYTHVSKERLLSATLPKAWAQLIQDEDEMLLEILADRVENICGFKPDPDIVARFLKNGFATRPAPLTSPSGPLPQSSTLSPRPVPSPAGTPPGATVDPTALSRIGFTLNGEFRSARNAIDVLRQVFEALTQKDPSFPERFGALPKHGNKRRYLARDASELYPNRPDLCRENAIKLNSGWWLGTNHSRQTISRIIEMACETAHIRNGKDLVAHLG